VNEGFAMSSFEWVELETLTSDIEAARSRLAEARKRNNQGAVGRLEVEITRAEKRRSDLLAHISTSVASEPDPPPRARETAGSRQAAAAAEALQEEADAAQPPGDTAGDPEPDPLPEAVDGANARQAAASAAEALQDEVDAAQPPGDTAGDPEPDPLPEEKDGANSSQASASAAEALPGEADGEQPLPDRVDRIVAGGAASTAAALRADGIGGGSIMWDQLKPSDIERAKSELGDRRAEMLARHAEELKGLDVDQNQLETLERAIASFLQKFNASSPDSAVVKLDEERELRQQAGQQPS
jgi:hypothetical protein